MSIENYVFNAQTRKVLIQYGWIDRVADNHAAQPQNFFQSIIQF